MHNKNISITLAKEVSKRTGFQEIVILGYDPETNIQHVTTYGKSLKQCEDAAKAGNFIKTALKWPEELCKAKPARVQKKEL